MTSVVGGTHGCISPDVKGTSDCSKYQLVQLINVHALQQTRRLEVIHDVWCALVKLCINVKLCVAGLQTPFICMAFTLNMWLFRSLLIVQPIFSLLRWWWTACSKTRTFRKHFTQLHATLTKIYIWSIDYILNCLLVTYFNLASSKNLYFYQK